MSFLVLMVLSYITVRSNKISTPKLKRISIKSIRQLQSLPSGSSLVRVNEAEPQDAEVAKWKAAELFKVGQRKLLCRNDTSLYVDHGELSASDRHCRGHQRQVDSGTGRAVRRRR